MVSLYPQNNKIFLFLIFVLILTSSHFALKQSGSNVEAAKRQLEELQKQLQQIDASERLELSRRRQNSEKGEFETSKQFELRSKKEEEDWLAAYRQLNHQQGIERIVVHKKINEILNSEFISEFGGELGTYDADKQIFPLLLNGVSQGTILVSLNEAPELKVNFQKAIKTIKLGLTLNELNQATEYIISGRITYRGKSYVMERADLEIAAAMRMLFGNYDPSKKLSAWSLELVSPESEVERYDRTLVYAKSIKVQSFTQNGIAKRILIAASAPTLDEYSCHACSMYLSVGVFRKTDGAWRVEQVQKNLGQFGSWGNVTAPVLTRIGNDKYALVDESWDMGQGYEEGFTSVFSIENGTIREILHLKTHENNTGAVERVKEQIVRQGKVAFRPTATSEYFEAILTTTGRIPTSIGKRLILKPFTKTEIFRFSNGAYRLVAP